MDRLVVGLLVFCSLVMTFGSTALQLKPSKDEQIENLLKMTLPLFRQNMINRQEIDSFYKLFNNEDNGERTELKRPAKSAIADIGSFESVKRKLGDDYGHLRFGRNDPSQDRSGQSQDSKWNSRSKYNDPDYGHMRFG